MKSLSLGVKHSKYSSAHNWIKKHSGRPAKCEHCELENLRFANGQIAYDWANVSGEYLQERSDWKRLCRKCHYRFDAELHKKSAPRNFINKLRRDITYNICHVGSPRERLFDKPKPEYSIVKYLSPTLRARWFKLKAMGKI